MAPPLDQHTVQRLAYVRYLFREGVEQSKQPPPLRSRAITSFHDAVENFLGLVAQYLNVELKKNTEFLGYWEAIKPQHELPKKEQMKRLNDARVALKHNGTFPSSHQIEQARETVIDFLTTVTPKVFDVDIDSIDMVDLLTQPKTKQLLRDAQTHADVGDFMHASAGLGLAMEALMDHYAGRDAYARIPSPFAFGESIYHFDRPKKHGIGQSLEASLAKTMDIVSELQVALRVISLGIDLPNYLRFSARVPLVNGFLDGRKRYAVADSYQSITAEDYEWARHFVIESALRAARADGIHEMLEADAQINFKASLDRQRRYEQREWYGPADKTETDGTTDSEAGSPTLES
jgi:hypothetical protein